MSHLMKLRRTGTLREDDLDHPHYNDLATEIRKVVDEKFSYNAIIQATVIYTNEGVLTLKREWRNKK